jgi:CBS domain-containing protein
MLTARQIMRQPVHIVHRADSVARAVRLMQTHRVSSLLVPPRFEGEEYGIITKADVISKVVAQGRDPLRVHVSEVMTTSLHTIGPDCTLRECAALMMRHRIRRLPVFADGRPIGIVGDSDVFDTLLNFHTEAAASFSL